MDNLPVSPCDSFVILLSDAAVNHVADDYNNTFVLFIIIIAKLL